VLFNDNETKEHEMIRATDTNGREMHNNFSGKPEGKESFGRSRRRWKKVFK
jgi:hypothetical protein